VKVQDTLFAKKPKTESFTPAFAFRYVDSITKMTLESKIIGFYLKLKQEFSQKRC